MLISDGQQDMPSGFQPTNTLKRPVNAALETLQTHPIESKNAKRRKANPCLELEPSTGNNVQPKANRLGSNFSQLNAPPSKGRNHKLPIVSDSPASTDDFDPLSSKGQNYIVSHVSIRAKDTQEARSRGSSICSSGPKIDCKRSPYLGMGVPEFTMVQNTMNSTRRSSRHSQRHKRVVQKQGDYSMNTLNYSNPASPTDAGPISGKPGKMSEKSKFGLYVKYQGTIGTAQDRGAQKIIGGKKNEHDTGLVSSYFPKSPRDIPTNVPIPTTRSQDTNVRYRFRDDHGNHRGFNDENLSSDELVSSTIAESLMLPERASRQKHSRSASPTKTSYSMQQATISKPIGIGLPASNIRPSEFITHKAGASNRQKLDQVANGRGKDSFGKTKLDGYILGGEFVQGSFHLVFNDADKFFDIFESGENGKNITSENPSLRLRLSKLQKITYSSESPKVHLESSRSGTLDHILDIQLSSVKSATEFVTFLQSFRLGPNPKVTLSPK